MVVMQYLKIRALKIEVVSYNLFIFDVVALTTCTYT
jgi:hypothetical protein